MQIRLTLLLHDIDVDIVVIKIIHRNARSCKVGQLTLVLEAFNYKNHCNTSFFYYIHCIHVSIDVRVSWRN